LYLSITTDRFYDALREIDSKVKPTPSARTSLVNLMQFFFDVADEPALVKVNPVKVRIDDEEKPQFLKIEEGKVSFHFRIDGKNLTFDRYVVAN
jgi:hypothetical protein